MVKYDQIRSARDETSYGRLMIMLKKTNYRVWSIVVEQTLREHKLWQRVTGTAVRPPATCAVTLAIADVIACML